MIIIDDDINNNSNAKFKGEYIPKDKERINSYKLTNEGYALLNLVERIKGGESKREEPQKEQPKQEEQPQRSTYSSRR